MENTLTQLAIYNNGKKKAAAIMTAIQLLAVVGIVTYFAVKAWYNV